MLEEKAGGQGGLQCRVQGARASDEAEEGDAVRGDGLQGRDPDMTKVWYREQRDSRGVTGRVTSGRGGGGWEGWLTELLAAGHGE